ncbi:MAG: hypothetical protein LBD27_03590 [Tannerella sp.]|jgi:hypothetical protein|nr:hypothetical protein [Tannerella sp.]
MNTEFKNAMLRRTDEELIGIVTVEREEWQPAAVEAAEEEIGRRSIDAVRIEQVKQKRLDEQAQEQILAQLRRKKPWYAKLGGCTVNLICFLIIDAIIYGIIHLLYWIRQCILQGTF